MNELNELNNCRFISKSNALPLFSAYFQYGRHALFEILRVNKIGEKDQVLIPDFICIDVLGAIRAAGAEPVFYSVSEKLIANQLPKNNTIKAVIAVNYFGFAQDLNLFEKYCKENNTILIEDNAHGFLSKDCNGEWLGTRCNFGIFSLRKTIFSIDGGALWLKHPSLFSDIKILEPLMTRMPTKIRFKIFFNDLQVKTRIPIGFAIDYLFRYLRLLSTGSFFPKVNYELENLMPKVEASHAHILQKISNTNIILEANRRKMLFYKVKDNLSKFNIDPIYNDIPDGTTPYGYPFRTSPEELIKVSKKIAKLGLYPVKWPDLPSSVILSAPEYYKNVYLINFI